jgi:ribosome biogenesis GTPase A
MHWTATEIMTAYANKKGWVTAKAGRPDIHRAGNASEYPWNEYYFCRMFNNQW